MAETIMQVKDVVKHYPLTRGIVFKKTVGQVRAVDGVSFDLHKVKLSGSSVSPVAASPPGQVDHASGGSDCGEIWFEGGTWRTWARRPCSKRRHSNRAAGSVYLVEPRMTVGDIVGEPFEIHTSVLPAATARRLFGTRSKSSG